MKSYCVKQRKQTECLPGSETYAMARNGRRMMKCKCAECGITKTRFVKGTTGKVTKTRSVKGTKGKVTKTRSVKGTTGKVTKTRSVKGTKGKVTKTRSVKGTKGKGLLLGKNSPFRNIPV